MEWSDDALVLSARPHGEAAAIVALLTRDHGRHLGLVPGGASARRRAALEPGTAVRAKWRARLADHLGTWTLEPERQTGALLLDDRSRLAALVSACALLEAVLPERLPLPSVHAGTAALFESLDGPAWAAAYVRWEVGLLAELGFGLDLSACAATGSADDLAFVSPRTGRAVSRAGGAGFEDRLLPLPGFLLGAGPDDPAAIRDGLRLTGHFLERQAGAMLPPARVRFAERFHSGPGTGNPFRS
jgi:DNA repair protein RecO (recombination protein O)